MMRNSNGQALSEYGFIGALTAVLAIGGLLLLGGDLSGLLSGAGGGAGGGTVGLFARQAAHLGAFATPPDLLPDSDYMRNGGAVTVRIDEKTGQIFFDAGLSGDASDTAAAPGNTAALATQLKQLVLDWRDSEGNQADPELAQKILELAERGHVLAERQHDVTAENGGDDMVSYRMDLVNHAAKDFKNRYDTFEQTFDTVTQRTGNAQDYQQLKKMVDFYSGVISNVSYDTFTSKTNDAADPTIYFKAGADVKIETTAAEAPLITHYSSDRLDEAGNEVKQ